MARGSDPLKVAEWRERFSRFASWEGKTSAFCAAEGVSVASFYAWRRKLGLSSARRSKQPAVHGFEPILVRPAAMLSVRLPGDIAVEATGEEAMRTLVSELVRATSQEGRSC